MRSMRFCATLLVALGLAGCGVLNNVDSGPAGAKGYTWSASMERKRLALEKATDHSGISVLRTKDNELQVNVPSDFSFDVNSAALKPAMHPVLDHFVEDLEIPAMSRMLILVVGHTDSRGEDAVNDPLSLARAQAVRKYLEAKGIPGARITIEGRGEREPLVAGDVGYARALNRRVEIFLREPAS